MNAKTLAVLACLPLAASAAVPGKMVSDNVALKPDATVKIDVETGSLTVSPGRLGWFAYDVSFKPRQSLLQRLGLGSSSADLSKCAASYTEAEGLKVTGCGEARVKVWAVVPPEQGVDVRVGTGVAELGKLAGNVRAEVGTGVLRFDGRGLPAGACVSATVKTGATDNKRDQGCKTTPVSLHAGTGTIDVR